MPTSQFIGHVSIHHLVPPHAPPEAYVGVDDGWSVFSEHCSPRSLFVVREFGTEEGHPHYHFFFETEKSSSTCRRHLISAFSRPGVPNPGQHVSIKSADPAKLPSYFVYLCKGPHGVLLPPPRTLSGWIIRDDGPRLIDELHEQYHKTAQEIRDRKKRKGVQGSWYENLAETCRQKRATSKEDVMQVVSHYYVYESKKGFDKFAVMRTFWAVFSLVSGGDAHELLLEQCNSMLAA